MEQREKILATIVGVLLVVLGGLYTYGSIDGAFDSRHKRITNLRGEIQVKQKHLADGVKAARRIAEFAERSLPGEEELASSQYREWLLDLVVERVGLADPGVAALPTQPGDDDYDQLTFQVSGQGNLRQLTQLLYHFYSVSYLHRIHNMTVTPINSSRNLKINLRIQALLLPDAKDRRSLPEGPANRLASKDLAHYEQVILARDFFSPPNHPPQMAELESQNGHMNNVVYATAVGSDEDALDKLTYSLGEGAPEGATIDPASGLFEWTPDETGTFSVQLVVSDDALLPKKASQTVEIVIAEGPPKPKLPDEADAKVTTLSGITEDGGIRRVWLLNTSDKKQQILKEGDSFQVGQSSAVVGPIGVADVVLVCDDQRLRAILGKPLSEAVAIPPAAAPKTTQKVPTSAAR